MRVSIISELERIGAARRVRRDDEADTGLHLSETALVAAGHSAEDAKRVVEAEKSGNLVVELGPGCQ